MKENEILRNQVKELENHIKDLQRRNSEISSLRTKNTSLVNDDIHEAQISNLSDVIAKLECELAQMQEE